MGREHEDSIIGSYDNNLAGTEVAAATGSSDADAIIATFIELTRNPEFRDLLTKRPDKFYAAYLVLMPDQQQLLLLRYGQKLPFQAIYALGTLGTSALKARQHRALARLEGLLGMSLDLSQLRERKEITEPSIPSPSFIPKLLEPDFLYEVLAQRLLADAADLFLLNRHVSILQLCYAIGRLEPSQQEYLYDLLIFGMSPHQIAKEQGWTIEASRQIKDGRIRLAINNALAECWGNEDAIPTVLARPLIKRRRQGHEQEQLQQHIPVDTVSEASVPINIISGVLVDAVVSASRREFPRQRDIATCQEAIDSFFYAVTDCLSYLYGLDEVYRSDPLVSMFLTNFPAPNPEQPYDNVRISGTPETITEEALRRLMISLERVCITIHRDRIPRPEGLFKAAISLCSGVADVYNILTRESVRYVDPKVFETIKMIGVYAERLTR